MLTQDSSHESEFETLVIKCFAIYGTVFSLGKTFSTNCVILKILTFFSKGGLGQDEATKAEESYLSLGGGVRETIFLLKIKFQIWPYCRIERRAGLVHATYLGHISLSTVITNCLCQ